MIIPMETSYFVIRILCQYYKHQKTSKTNTKYILYLPSWGVINPNLSWTPMNTMVKIINIIQLSNYHWKIHIIWSSNTYPKSVIIPISSNYTQHHHWKFPIHIPFIIDNPNVSMNLPFNGLVCWGKFTGEHPIYWVGKSMVSKWS